MKKMTQAELDQVLQQHALWLQSNGDQGAQADLSHADLFHTSLSYANLTGASLSRADLSGVDLTGANLSRADLSGAGLYHANLTGAQLAGVSLSGVSLSHANLTGTQISADTRLHQCSDFRHLTCSPDALPWLILHPKWSEWKSTVTVVEDPVNIGQLSTPKHVAV